MILENRLGAFCLGPHLIVGPEIVADNLSSPIEIEMGEEKSSRKRSL